MVKTRALDWEARVYKKRIAYPEFVEFYLPFGGRLRADNRWVQMSRVIPWAEIEPRYAHSFSKKKGRRAKTIRVALGALIIKEKLNLTDEETILQIQENPYLQYFLGFESYQEDPIFEASLMVYFRKRLGPEIIGELNELIAKKFVETKKRTKKKEKVDKDDESDNDGQLILDATCIPQDIRFPNDVGLLDDARKKLEGMVDTLYAESELKKKPRTYRIRARKQYLTFARGRRRTKQQIRKATRQQLQYVGRNLRTVKELIKAVPEGRLSRKEYKDLLVIQKAYDQQVYLYQNNEHAIRGKIISLSQPHVRPIARGKARGAYEFGAKLSAAITEHGLMYIDRLSWEPYNESGDLKMKVERYKERFGHYPESVHVDKIYRTRENRQWCEEKKIRLSGPPLGRPASTTGIDKKILRAKRKQERYDESIRQAIEGAFGVSKRRYGLDCVYEKLKITSETTIMVNMLVMNVEKIMKDLYALILSRILALIIEMKLVFNAGFTG